jgi:thioredoxin 1
MKRRQFLILSSLAGLAATTAHAAEPAAYSAELVATELAAGKAVLIDFSASWCPSCQTQGRLIERLRAENPAYDAAITFIEADWDTYQDTELATRYGVTSRGSLVVLRGDAVIAQTSTHGTEDELRALLDQAASAA